MSRPSATRPAYGSEPFLYMAMELSRDTWRVGFMNSQGKRRQKSIVAGKTQEVAQEIDKAKKALGLPDEARVLSCYEAGRDGSWIHRWLLSIGVENLIVDAASIQVARHGRRAKTDRIDLALLLEGLHRWHRGEKPWSVVRVLAAEHEDARRLTRELSRLKKERTAHMNRIRALLFSENVRPAKLHKLLGTLDLVRIWNGQPLPPHLQKQIERESARLNLVETQIKEIAKEQAWLIDNARLGVLKKARLLSQIHGIGNDSAYLLATEHLGRLFNNRREVGAAAGLDGTPWASGTMNREQGISKRGNPRVRGRMIELAWCWLRFQPQSESAQWFQRKFGAGTKRNRRVGVVALARRLLVELWHWVEDGVAPKGARLAA